MRYTCLLVLTWAFMVTNSLYGQEADSTQNQNKAPIFKSTAVTEIRTGDTLSPGAVITVDSFLWEYRVRKNAKRAGLYSALLPGLGQAYNKAYWRIGAIYAVLGTSTGFIIYNYNEWNDAKRELAYRQNYNMTRDPKLIYLTNNQLAAKQSYDKQNLDLSVLLTGVGYILNIIEAISYNHLKDFDISPDISMRFKASALPNNQIGIGLAFYFK